MAAPASADKIENIEVEQRYVLMKSCSLTSANKAQLVEALAPFCREPGDIGAR